MADKPLEKIMCVEDEPDIQEIVKMALKEVGGNAAVVKAKATYEDLGATVRSLVAQNREN